MAQGEQLARKATTFSTRRGLPVKMGGFLEIDFIGDNAQSFKEIIGNQAVLRTDTVGGTNSQLISSPWNSRITFDVRAPEQENTWVGGGYGTIYPSNASQMTCTMSAAACGGAVRTPQSIYIRDPTYYAYVFHDLTSEIRAGLETN